MDKFLEPSEIIDFEHPAVAAKAQELAEGCNSDTKIAKRCFEFVRDEIRHTGDAGAGITTLRASEVLEQAQGWCYAKSHLLAALLRANGIPTALCYQRLSCSEYIEGIYCLHGLNAVYLKDYGWYRVDARGNKVRVDAQFDPSNEKLAFELTENEYDLPDLYAEPLDVVVKALKTHKNYGEMVGNFPDIKNRNIDMIVHSRDGIKKSFYGVDFLVLSHSENTMLTKMLYKVSDVVSMHSHPNEQCGYVISGKYRIRFMNYDTEIEAGDSYIIPANIEHSIEIIEGGEVLDCFNPPREDYL